MEFTFYKLNVAGIVDSAERLKLNDEQAALAHARSLRDQARIEIWAGARRVAVVPPAKVASFG